MIWAFRSEVFKKTLKSQELSGDPNPQYFLKSTAVQMGGVLPYKWETYCRTNGRCIAWFPFIQSIKRRKVHRYKWGAYCRTNWRCIAVLSLRPVGVGVSDTLLKRLLGLVAQCSAMGVSVAATPPCSAIGFFAREFPRDTVTGRWQDRCDTGSFWNGGGGMWRDTPVTSLEFP